MNKLLRKINEKLIEFFIKNVFVIIITVTGISITSTYLFFDKILSTTFSLRQIIIFFLIIFFLFLLVIFFMIKRKSKRMFKEGTKVILSTNYPPIMSIGKYNLFNNKVQCSWSVEKDIKHQWINQNQLVEYIPTQYNSIKRNENSIWKNRNHY